MRTCVWMLICLCIACLCPARAYSSAATILPKAPEPSAHLTVCDVSDAPLDEVLFYISVQGIVNQTEPRIYLIIDKDYDQVWLDWMRERGYVKRMTRVGPGELLSRFRSEINGAVVYDPDLPATINLATMIAGVHRFAILSPGLVKTFDLHVKSDLRGRFKDNAEAYSWAIERLMPKLNKRVLCSFYPYAAQHRVRDYCIQQKIFTFWVIGPDDKSQAGANPGERGVIERAFRATKTNAPVIGFWYAGDQAPGISEYEGLKWAGAFGKPTICHDWATNTSIHAGLSVDPLIFRRKKAPSPALKEDRVYVSVSVTESGDAPWYWQRRMRTVWEDPDRGKVPISWCIGPGTLDIHPAILEWYYRNATPNDDFFVAMSGATYMIPQYFARGTADPDSVWKEFFGLTDRYMRLLDLDAITLHNDIWNVPTQYEESPYFRKFAENLPRLRTILADFGRMEDMDPARANHRTSRDVNVFHCLNRWDIEGNPGEWLADQIRERTPDERPAFMHVMALSWTFTPSDILKASEILGDGYEFVTVSQLDALYRAQERADRTGIEKH